MSAVARTLNDLYLDIRRVLKNAGVSSPGLEARELCAAGCGADKNRIAQWGHHFLARESEEKVMALLQRRLDGEPLAYIIGEWDFYGETFVVTPDVLIPRSDTESLAEFVIELAQKQVNPRILDLCCGSGCIGLVVAKHVEDARVVGVDVSDRALCIARENCRRLGLGRRYFTVHGDARLPASEGLGKFDILVSNPPYIPSREIARLDRDVRDYEPHLALDGGENGLEFFQSIARDWQGVLRGGGVMAFECGVFQAGDVADLMVESGLEQVGMREDLSGIQRVVYGTVHEENEQMLQFSF